MQTLKINTRKRILEVSKRLFLKKGFRGMEKDDKDLTVARGGVRAG